MEFRYVAFIKNLSKDDLPLVGGKAANLGEMVNAGLPVPDAFVVTAEAYKEFLKRTKLKRKILQILKETDFNNPSVLEENTKKIRELVESAKMPEDIEKEIVEAYKQLSKEFGKDEEYVAVRSSATAEDVPTASFAGQQLTLLNIKNEENVVKAVQKCWASLFTARATFYRQQKGFKHEKVFIAVVVQKQLGVLSKEDYLQGKYKAGIGFTIHPVTGEKNKIVIEASYGQGEAVVSGAVNPDTYIIDKTSGKVLETHVGAKEKMEITKEAGELEEIEVPEEMRKVLCLSEDEIKQLWNLARKLEEHYNFPQDFEWASENGKVYLVQSRPVTVFYEKKEAKVIVEKPPILKGLPASPGVAIGKVKVCLSIEEARQKLEKGDILVTKMTSPDMVPLLRSAIGIITDEGGLTCFSGDTKILTQHGFISLKELYKKFKNENRVFFTPSLDTSNLTIVWRKITNVTKRMSKVIKVIVSPTGRSNQNFLKVTPDHKFITLNCRKIMTKPITEIIEDNEGICVVEKIPPFSENLSSDIDLAYLCGSIFSDGYIGRNLQGGYITSFYQKLANPKVDFIDKVKGLLSDLSGGVVHEKVDRDIYTIYNYRKNIYQIFAEKKDNLIPWLLSLDEKSIKSFLAGAIDGDGNFSHHQIQITVGKRKLNFLYGVITAFLRIGIVPNVIFRKKDNTFVVYTTESTDKLTEYTTRVKNNVKRRFDSKRFLAKQLLSDIIDEVNYKGKIKYPYLKRNLMISKEKILKSILPRVKDHIVKEELQKLLSSPLKMFRVKRVADGGIEDVYNITVEAENELDHNYIVFSELFTPVLVSNCHAAIVSRELGIPCIVGSGNATQVLKDGMVVTLDSRNGLVYEGEFRDLLEREKSLEVSPEEAAKLKTRTKILMNLGVPMEIEKYKHLPFDGIGLMRIEFIIAEWIKEHPNYLIEKGEHQKYIDKLAEGIAIVAKAIYPRFVVVRFSDFKTNEYRQLTGGEKYEPIEANPMLGWRGVSRYISKEFEQAFRLECRAIRKVREELKLDNVWVMLPFVRTTWEVEKCLKIMEEEGLKRSENFKIWAMIEVPSAIFIVDKLAKYFDGFSIGSNDLTMLILGVDRDSAILANMGYFDEKNEAVLRAMKELIKKAHKKSVTVSICGQSVSVYPEVTKFLVKCGIDSVSVNPDTVASTKKLVYEIENGL